MPGKLSNPTSNPSNCLINGQPADTLSVANRGFNYGDGLFETLKVSRGVPVFWAEHMARLTQGCRRLALPVVDPALLRNDVESLLAASKLNEAVIKIVITRGAAGRGYRPAVDVAAERMVSIAAAPQYPPECAIEGIELFACQARLGINPQLAGIKHLNRLEQVLARGEWQDEYLEGLVCDLNGFVIEGTMSNLFLLTDNTLRTPVLDQCGVAGVVRGVILREAEGMGLKVEVGRITRSDVVAAEGLFMTNSLIGVWPVKRFQQNSYQPNTFIDKVVSLVQAAESASQLAYRNLIS